MTSLSYLLISLSSGNGSLGAHGVTNSARLSPHSAGWASVAPADGDAQGQPCPLPFLPQQVGSAGDGGLFLLVLDRWDHHSTQPDPRIPAGPAAAALSDHLTAQRGLATTRPPAPSLSSLGGAARSCSAATAAWGCPRTRRIPTHPLARKARDHQTLGPLSGPGDGVGPREPGPF